MAYQTSTGTFDQMTAALASFALANGWSAPTPPADQRYWRVVMASRNASNQTVHIRNLDFKDSLGASIGGPTTALASTTRTGSAGGAFGAGGWQSEFNVGAIHWVGGDWVTDQEVRGVAVDFSTPFDDNSEQPIDVSVEYSSDGVTWTTLTVFSTQGDYTPVTYTFDPTTWPLTPGDNLLFNISKVQSIEDGYGQEVEYLPPVNGVTTIYPAFYFVKMGKTNMAGSLDPNLSIHGPMPDNEQVAEWHFFTDTTVSNYIHCAWRMTYRGEPRWYHISMGIGDNKGLTHNGFGYLVHDGMMFYQDHSSATVGANRWRSLKNANPFVSTNMGGSNDLNEVNAAFYYLLDSGGSGYPFADDGSWPARGIVHTSGTFNIPHTAVYNLIEVGSSQVIAANNTKPGGYDLSCIVARVHPVSGYVSLGNLPVGPMAGKLVDDLACFIGEIPDMRTVRVDNASDGTEISQDVNTWKTFPRLRKTDIAVLDQQFYPTSGPVGWAYKKVV